jgi:glycosidase
MTKNQWKVGVKKMRLAALMQFTLPGVPCIYYGDEAGVEGYKDPFNRTGYPWGKENKELIGWYEKLGALRKSHPVFQEGEFLPVTAGNGVIGYIRRCESEEIFVVLNGTEEMRALHLPLQYHGTLPILGKVHGDILQLEGYGCAVFCLNRTENEKDRKK